METVEVKFDAPKETHEMGKAINGLMKNYKQAVADGFQVGQDIPAILMGSFNDLMAAIDGIDKIDDEFKKEPIKAAMGALVPLADAIGELVKKDDKPE